MRPTNDSLDTSEREAAAFTPPARNPAPLDDPDAILHRVEQEVGCGHRDWDLIDPHELIRACVKHASPQAEPFSETWPSGQTQGVMTMDRPVTFGGCPFCGRQDCVAGSCRSQPAPQIKQQPFAYFVWEPSPGKWSQVMHSAAGQPGVIAAYANPLQS